MRPSILNVAFIAALVLLAASCPALEKTPGRIPADAGDEWSTRHSTCSVSYYNICTGWIWIWSGFADGEILGTVFEGCCGPGGYTTVDGVYLYYWTGATTGYGFTGTHALYAVDANDCPTGSAIASTPWLPTSGWNLTLYGGVSVPNRFAYQISIQDDDGYVTPVALPSDGPQACGLCFPTTRTTNSYFWGLDTSPVCPGSAVFDGACYVEWLSAALVTCGGCMAVESASWGTVKSLYR